MGKDTSIQEFILSINKDYFTNRLLGANSGNCFDAKKTFAELRKHIRTEIMPWHKHMDFQKHMREAINNFQKECEGSESFISGFHSFVKSLDFYLINDRHERSSIEEQFTAIQEPWFFICEKPDQNTIWLNNLFVSLQQEIRNNLKKAA